MKGCKLNVSIKKTIFVTVRSMSTSISTQNYENDKCVAKWFEPLCKVSEGKYHFLTDRNSHNDLHRLDHPIRDDYHCWLFHSLYDHKHLSWKKMAEIKHVHWIIRPEHSYGVELSELCND
jgi:hypothetical protein